MLKLAVFASHGGSALQAVLDAIANGTLTAKVVLVVSNNSDSLALQRARDASLPFVHVSGKTHPDAKDRDRFIARTVLASGADYILLAGYMKQLGEDVLRAFNKRIINTHPSLLPKYGGKGYYGLRVHKAVLEAGDQVTGVTAHVVTENYDEGPILRQSEVRVMSEDTPESLQSRVKVAEQKLVVEVIRDLHNTADKTTSTTS